MAARGVFNLHLLTLCLFAAAHVAALPASKAAPREDALQTCAALLDGQLQGQPAGFNFSGNVRRYYVAAEEVEWNYAPTEWDNWLGVPIQFSPRAYAAGVNQYGTTWLKALYRGYADSSFTCYSQQEPWQGAQGPTLRAEIGDMIEIMFVNKLTKNYATMHSMGLIYTKASGGAAYPNNTVPGENVVLAEEDAVPPVSEGVAPGGCVVYKWIVDDVDSPPAGEPSKTHSYHSYVALQQDTDAGLVGPTIIYARGQMDRTMASYREFTLLFNMYDESDSWLSAQNKAALQGNARLQGVVQGGRPAWLNGSGPAANNGRGSFNTGGDDVIPPGNQTIWHPQLVNLAGAGQFGGAPTFFAMNGYVFANNPSFDMCFNDNVIWYVNSYGSASHVFHMHGNSFYYHGASEYAIDINNGVGKTLYMNATGTGIWQVLCHVNYHHTLGMVGNYRVYTEDYCPLPALECSS